MAIYLKKFETQAAYEAAESSLILPNVSLTVDNNTVHYNPSSPIPPTPDGHLYAKAFDEYGTIGICDSLGKFVWFDVNGNAEILCTGQGTEAVVQGYASYWLIPPSEMEGQIELEPNSIASITDIEDIGGMTILGSLATNDEYNEYEVSFDPKETLLTE